MVAIVAYLCPNYPVVSLSSHSKPPCSAPWLPATSPSLSPGAALDQDQKKLSKTCAPLVLYLGKKIEEKIEAAKDLDKSQKGNHF